MPILAPHQTCSASLPGCAGHLPTDHGFTHISVEQVVVGVEGDRACVSREQAPGESPAVRIQGAANMPMQPVQAMQLGLALIAEALAATTWTVS